MSVSMMKHLVTFITITLVMLQIGGVNSQLSLLTTGIPAIISLLENVNDTSGFTASMLPQLELERSLRSQENLQNLTNILMGNSRASSDEALSLLTEFHMILKDHVSKEGAYGNETIGLQREQLLVEHDCQMALEKQQRALTSMVNSQTESANALTHIAGIQNDTLATTSKMEEKQTQAVSSLNAINETQRQMSSTMVNIEATLTHDSDTLTQIASTEHQIVGILTEMNETQAQMADTEAQNSNILAEIADTQAHALTALNQISYTQSQLANSFNQIASLLQLQSEQQQNMTAAINTVVAVLERQQETLEGILEARTPCLVECNDASEATTKVVETSTKAVEISTKAVENSTEAVEISTEAVGVIITSEASEITTKIGRPTTTTAVTTDLSIRDCSELASLGPHPSGIYMIHPNESLSFKAYCEMDSDSGGWTVFQKRFNGSVDFYRNWDNYTQGFGSLDAEFWWGLEKIYLMMITSQKAWQMMIQIEDFNSYSVYANYQPFSIGDAASKYVLSYEDYSGTAGDALKHHNNRPFSTYDWDNDGHSENCAELNGGAWWYWSCRSSNLNGRYLGPSDWTGFSWSYGRLNFQALKTSTMMIRPIVS